MVLVVVKGDGNGQLSTSPLVEACRRAGVTDERVLEAVGAVDRGEFVPRFRRGETSRDAPVPIGKGQTTSQPSLIARMIEVLELDPDDTVLEVGTGSGYQTVLLARLAGRVVSVEAVAKLAEQARERLAHLANVEVHVCDGTLGWPDAAPYDAITVGASGPHVPTALVDQLADGGRLVIPVDRPGGSRLELYEKRDGELQGPDRVLPVRFVPLVGEDGYPDR